MGLQTFLTVWRWVSFMVDYLIISIIKSTFLPCMRGKSITLAWLIQSPSSQNLSTIFNALLSNSKTCSNFTVTNTTRSPAYLNKDTPLTKSFQENIQYYIPQYTRDKTPPCRRYELFWRSKDQWKNSLTEKRALLLSHSFTTQLNCTAFKNLTSPGRWINILTPMAGK